jgi:hypothetical protein
MGTGDIYVNWPYYTRDPQHDHLHSERLADKAPLELLARSLTVFCQLATATMQIRKGKARKSPTFQSEP